MKTIAALAVLAWIATPHPLHAAQPGPGAPDEAASAAKVARGRYLVTVAVCNDCHTPWKAGENGPEPDYGRMLSGHP